MNSRYKLAMKLSLTILIVFWGAELAHAQSAGTVSKTKTAMEEGNPIQSQNKRQKTPNSARKAAAARLKSVHQMVRAEKMAEEVSKHRGKGDSK